MSFRNFLASYVRQVLLAIDRLGNALLDGNSRETISSRVGRAQKDGRWFAVHIAAPVINFLMNNPNHCIEAIGT